MIMSNKVLIEIHKVLLSMKYCIENSVEWYDNVKLRVSCGICFHCKKYISLSISGSSIDDELAIAFNKLHLHSDYPVEMQFTKNLTIAAMAYGREFNKYSPNNQYGVARLKLLNDLISYCESQILIS